MFVAAHEQHLLTESSVYLHINTSFVPVCHLKMILSLIELKLEFDIKSLNSYCSKSTRCLSFLFLLMLHWILTFPCWIILHSFFYITSIVQVIIFNHYNMTISVLIVNDNLKKKNNNFVFGCHMVLDDDYNTSKWRHYHGVCTSHDQHHR
jgi:hypothetical protein